MLFFLAALGLVAASAQPLARGNVLVYKKLSAPATNDALIKGRNFTVYYQVMNIGQSAAYDVKVKDEWPVDSFDVLDGKAAASYGELSAGANETFHLVLRPKVVGTMQTARASVDYKYKSSEAAAVDGIVQPAGDDEDDLVDQTSYSTSPGRVQIYTEADYLRYTRTAEPEGWAAAVASVAVVALAYTQWQAAVAVNTRKVQ